MLSIIQNFFHIAAKSFDRQSKFIITTYIFFADMKEILNVQRNLFLDPYLAQFLNLSAEVFFLCN